MVSIRPRRSTSVARSVLDKRIIDEFAPVVPQLVELGVTSAESVQLFLEEVERRRCEEREMLWPPAANGSGNKSLHRLLDGLFRLPAPQREILLPFIALAFELYVPGVVLPPNLRSAVSELLASLALVDSASYVEARLELERRYAEVDLSRDLVAKLAA